MGFRVFWVCNLHALPRHTFFAEIVGEDWGDQCRRDCGRRPCTWKSRFAQILHYGQRLGAENRQNLDDRKPWIFVNVSSDTVIYFLGQFWKENSTKKFPKFWGSRQSRQTEFHVEPLALQLSPSSLQSSSSRIIIIATTISIMSIMLHSHDVSIMLHLRDVSTR